MPPKATRPCGTPAAERRHRRHGDWPCAECRRLNPPVPRKRARCGTRAGYVRHRKRGEKACPPCLAANAAYSRGEDPPPLPKRSDTAA